MNVVSVPSPNFTSGRPGPILGIVNHIMAGTLAGTDAWFQRPASQVSAHYGIGKDGSIHKYVDDKDQAWHAGVVIRPTASLVLKHPGINPNAYLLGIEHEGESGDRLTDQQYQASLWLHQQLIKAFSIPIDREHLIAHSEINATHGGCPGPGFPWDTLLEDLCQSLKP